MSANVRSLEELDRNRRRTLFIGIVVVVAVGLTILVVCVAFQETESVHSDQDPRLTYATPYRNVHPETRYVGTAVCAGCHPKEAESYRQHPMGRSLAPVTQASALPDDRNKGNPFEADGFRYQVEQQGERLFHRQTCLGSDGAVLTDVRVEVDFVVGSGERARSYLINRDGYLYQSPISWFADRQTWGLSPGYSQQRVGFGREIVPECLFCHSDRAEPISDTINHYASPPFQGHAIGCERCHGPGELHVARRERGEQVGAVDDTIVNPAHLEPVLREAVCEQCHLQGASRVIRRGRGVYDYRPGLPLHLFWSVFVRPAEATEQQFVGHVEQMHQSRCYKDSQGSRKMGCVSCHDPHAVPPAESKVAFFRDRCLQCHAESSCAVPLAQRRQQNAEDSCMACHMPRRPSADIGHTTTTDHRIVRQPKAPPAGMTPRVLRSGESPLRHFHQSLVESPDPDRDRDLGLALMDLARDPSPIQRQLSGTALDLLEKAVRRQPNDVAAWEARGQAFWQQKRAGEALASTEKALAVAPQRERALANAALYADALGQRDASLGYWERALVRNPWSASYRFGRARLWSEANDWPQARAECEAVLQFDPTNVDMRLLRVAHLIHRGETTQARTEFQTILDLHPRRPEALQRWFAEKLR